MNIVMAPGSPAAAITVQQALALARQAFECGEPGRSEQILQQVIQQQPKVNFAYSILSGLLQEDGRYPEQEALCRRWLAELPESLFAYRGLCEALRAQQRTPEAIAVLKRGFALEQRNVHLINHLGVLYKEMGQMAEALECFNLAIATVPLFSQPYWNRADICDDIPEAELQAMRAMAQDETLPREDRVHWCYALAHACEKRKAYGESFAFMTLGAQLKRGLIDYQHHREVEEMLRIPTRFSAAAMAPTVAVPGSASPIFICGLPRSGTTLIEHIVASHPDVVAGGELLELPRAAEVVLRQRGVQLAYPDWVPSASEQDWQAIGEIYLQRTAHLQTQRHFTDKMPLNFKALGVVHMALPQARIIHCIRHPLDTLLGCYKQLFSAGIRFSYDLDELADTYLCYRAVMDHWRGSFPGKILDVHYEDMVFDQERQTRRILDFLELDWSADCLAFHKSRRPVRTASNSQIRRPIFRSSLNSWKNYESQLAGLRARLEPVTGPL